MCVSLHSDACVAETGNDAHAAKLLHSLLYTHLLKVDLLSAVEFIDSLVVQANVQSAIESHPLTQTPPIQPSFMTFITNTLKSQVSVLSTDTGCAHPAFFRDLHHQHPQVSGECPVHRHRLCPSSLLV